MRKGTNPQKSKPYAKPGSFHQVVVPVYIPNHEDYFADALRILKICLSSLIQSSHSKTFITVVNNGSCAEVTGYLDGLFSEGSIHELIHTSNIGKINAIFKGMTGHHFPLVTVSDADVLFTHGWQQATYDIFNAFPKTGAVCPTPLSRNLKHDTSNIYFDRFFSDTLRFIPVKDPVAMQDFTNSIGHEKFLRQSHLEKNLAVVDKGVAAVVGAGHYVCTYRGSIFGKSVLRHIGNYIGGGNMGRFFDKPVLKKGYWRLSTQDNFTYHMGNTHESWMDEKAAKARTIGDHQLPDLKKENGTLLGYWLKVRVFSPVVTFNFIWRKFLWYKGLTKHQADHY